MNTVANRRARLSEWFEHRSLPPKDKSYFSQLINKLDSSFGEKAARRIERDCGMPHMYLDSPEPLKQETKSSVEEDLKDLLPEDAEVWRAQIKAAAIKARRGLHLPAYQDPPVTIKKA